MKKKLKQTVRTALSASLKDMPAGAPVSEKKNGQTKSNGIAKKNGKNSNVKHAEKSEKGSATINLTTFYSPELENSQLLQILLQVKEGNFTVRLPDDKIGLSGKIWDTLNQSISLNEMLMDELIQA